MTLYCVRCSEVMRTCGWIICSYCAPRLQFHARTWQQRANREDRISAVRPQTGSESVRNVYCCANCERQINEQQSHFVFPCRGSIPVMSVSALPPSLQVALCGFSVISFKFDVSVLSTLHTGRSVGRSAARNKSPVRQSAVCATDTYRSPSSPHLSRCLGLSEKLSHMRDTNEECLVQQLSSSDICRFTAGQEGHR
jgi:hypothetical protein